MIGILEKIGFATVKIRGIFIVVLGCFFVLVFHNRGQKPVAATCTMIATGLSFDASLLITTFI